jgi:hypothetical protein
MKRAELTRILAFLCAVLLLTGCGATAPSDAKESEAPVTGQETVEQEPAEPLSAPAEEQGPYSADYELLWEALETDYPYLDYLRGKGVDVDRIRESYAEQVRQAQDADEFAAILERMFLAMQNTAHLWVVSREDFPYFYSAYMEYIDPWRETVEAAAQAGYYSLSTESGSPDGNGLGYLPPVKVTWYADCSTLCITVKTFQHEVVERDRDVIWQAIAQYPDAENIVFDISNNSGGDTNYWIENIVAPFGEDQAFDLRMYYRDSPRNRLYVDAIVDAFFAESLPLEEVEAPAAWAEELGLDSVIVGELQIKGTPKIQSNAKRWVIVNGNVYSSAETFVCFCKSTGWATVIGTQTGGDGVGFDPALLLLPNSGLLVRFSIVAGESPGGGMNIEGTAPDVELKTGSIGYFLEYIRNERNK